MFNNIISSSLTQQYKTITISNYGLDTHNIQPCVYYCNNEHHVSVSFTESNCDRSITIFSNILRGIKVNYCDPQPVRGFQAYSCLFKIRKVDTVSCKAEYYGLDIFTINESLPYKLNKQISTWAGNMS